MCYVCLKPPLWWRGLSVGQYPRLCSSGVPSLQISSWEVSRCSHSLSSQLQQMLQGSCRCRYDYVALRLQMWYQQNTMWKNYGLRLIKRCNLWMWRRVRHTSGSGSNSQSNNIQDRGCPAPIVETPPEPRDHSRASSAPPPPPEYLAEMKDAAIIKNTIHALSPRIVAVHGPTGTGKSTVFPLAITHWAEHAEGLKQGLTICAQPRRILAQQLCERVRTNRKLWYSNKTVGYMIARESWKDSSSKLLYCTEAAIVALMMQTRLMTATSAQCQDEITTIVIDEVHNRSAHSDYVLALIAQIVITYHNDRAGKPLVNHTCHSEGSVNPSTRLWFSFMDLPRYTSSARSFREPLILAGQRCSFHCHFMVRAIRSVLKWFSPNHQCWQ